MISVDMKHFKEIFEHETVKVMRDHKVPGMSVMISKDNKTIYERAFGHRIKKEKKPATIDTLYGVSSITKSFTSMAILQLHEAKKLDINDPIKKYLPITIGHKDAPIRIRHLMSHASSIPNLHSFEFSQKAQELYKANIPNFPQGNWDDFYFHFNDAQSEILTPPDTKYYYNNGCFALLSQIIAKVNKKPFEEYVKENILETIGMTRSTFSNREAEKDDDVALGYNTQFVDEKLERYPKKLLSGPFIAGSGGLISSVRELTIYLQTYLNKGKINEKKILDPKLLELMYQPHNKNSKKDNSEYVGQAKQGYGYGWKIYENYYGYTLVTHIGISGVTGGNVAFIPELNITFAQLYNVSWLPTLLMHTALTLLLGLEPKEVIPAYKRKRHYKTLTGKYQAYKKIVTIEIKEEDGVLYLIDNNWYNKTKVPLIPKNDNPEVMNFYIINSSGPLNIPFTKHENGDITFEYERRLLHKKSKSINGDQSD